MNETFKMILRIALLLCVVQTIKGEEIAIDSSLRYSTLDNGFTYYVRHNAVPKGRADIYLILKVGSTVEREDESGYAHLLEHLLFEGTEHFPEYSIERFAMTHGASLLPDVNANTTHNYTTITFDKIDTSNAAVVDTVLMMLCDMVTNATLDDESLEKQRLIVVEEWRKGQSVDERNTQHVLEQLLPGTVYATRLPIGNMDVVTAATRGKLMNFYHRWYRPELMSLVAVGDFDADCVEERVKAVFGDIPNRDTTPRVFPKVEDHDGVRLVTNIDKENVASQFQLSFVYDDMPFESRNTVDYAREVNCRMLLSLLLQQRIQQRCLDPLSAIDSGTVDDSNMFSGMVVDKRSVSFDCMPRADVNSSFLDLMQTLAALREHGFSPGEVEAAKRLATSFYDNAAREADKLETASFVDEYSRHIKEGGYIPGIERERELCTSLISEITADDLNELLRRHITADNVNVIYLGVDSMQVPSAGRLAQMWKEALTAHYDVVDDDVDYEAPLVPHPIRAGSVVQRVFDKVTGTTRITLNNGATVLLKSTDFKNDEVFLGATARGGVHAVDLGHSTAARYCDMFTNTMRCGDYSQQQLSKRIASELCSIDFLIEENSHGLIGQGRTSSLKTLMELCHLYFDDVSPDTVVFNASRQGCATLVKDAPRKAENALAKVMSCMMCPDENYGAVFSADSINALTVTQCYDVYKQLTSNAADFVFVIVGNFDTDEAIDMACRYIGSLSGEPGHEIEARRTHLTDGVAQQPVVVDTSSARSSILMTVAGELHYSARNELMLKIFSNIIGQYLNMELRENYRLTYSVDVDATLDKIPGHMLMEIGFDVAPDNRDAAQRVVLDVLNNFYVDQSVFDETMSTLRAVHDIEVKTNAYWVRELLREGEGIDSLTGVDDLYDSVTVDEFDQWYRQQPFSSFLVAYTIAAAEK